MVLRMYLDPNNGENGKLYNGKPLEQLINLSGLQQNNIVPVKKTLVLRSDERSKYDLSTR